MSYQWSRADQHVGEGFLRIAREQIGKAAGWAENTAGPAAQRVHEARRRCKKLRALFRLVRPDFPEYREANAFVRDAARDLGSLRDTRVLQDTMSDLLARSGLTPAVPADDAAMETDAAAEGLARFAARMHELDRASGGWHVEHMTTATLAKGLRHTYRAGRHARRTALRHRTDAAFHDWRKYAKYHWNQLGLLEDAAPDVLPPAQQIAGELAELLGLHHDLAMVEDALARNPEQLGVAVDLAAIRPALLARKAELEAQAEKLGMQVFAEAPKALESRFLAYFSGWTMKGTPDSGD